MIVFSTPKKKKRRKEKKLETMNKNCNIMVAHWLYCLNESCACEKSNFISSSSKCFIKTFDKKI